MTLRKKYSIPFASKKLSLFEYHPWSRLGNLNYNKWRQIQIFVLNVAA